MKTNLINCDLVSLVGKNVKGIVAQVRSPRYINADMPAQYRTLTHLRQYKERGKNWIELYWKKENGDSCNFTGCTEESNSVMIQLTSEELKKMNEQSLFIV